VICKALDGFGGRKYEVVPTVLIFGGKVGCQPSLLHLCSLSRVKAFLTVNTSEGDFVWICEALLALLNYSRNILLQMYFMTHENTLRDILI
jgi:hypothetical protein